MHEEKILGIINGQVGNEYYCSLYFTSNRVIAAKTGNLFGAAGLAAAGLLWPIIAAILAKMRSKALKNYRLRTF